MEAITWFGPNAFPDWLQAKSMNGRPPHVDVVLITHGRDEQDLPRLFPWSEKLTVQERRDLTKLLRPAFGEIIQLSNLTAGILFLPFYADELIDPASRQECRRLLEAEGLQAAASAGARIVCLGGLTGALSLYGRRLLAPAKQLGIEITTGHSVTAISVIRTFLKVFDELGRNPDESHIAILGVGSIGSSFIKLLETQSIRPRSVTLVDRPIQQKHVERVQQELAEYGIATAVEFTSQDGQLDRASKCYDVDVLISAVSTPYVIDIDLVAPGTVLIDDSQPYCWSREQAWKRVATQSDIVPCEAGLVDCSSIGYRSRFPFDFADYDPEFGSHVSWSCLAEGLLHALDTSLPLTLGEPTFDILARHNEAFDARGFTAPILQCGAHPLPMHILRQSVVV